MSERPIVRGSLREHLDHLPVTLGFGTSGRRGLVKDLTPLEVYINALGELEFLKTLASDQGGIREGDVFFLAADLRPSSTLPALPGGGEIAQVILRAIQDAGLVPCYLGKIPTPALAAFAMGKGKGSIMVTGSHIPFDRNGYKTNTSIGELLKHHELPIAEHVGRVRERIYSSSIEASPFNPSGCFKESLLQLPDPDRGASRAYVQRYLEFMDPDALKGLRVVFYEHSAVGRDLVPEILRALGAEVLCCGRSDTFVPIDTENIDADCLDSMRALVLEASESMERVDALISTDGDSDRPLILAIDPKNGALRFFGGDLIGMISSKFLSPDAIVVPISCNDGIDRSELAPLVTEKTRIGSPYVIDGMMRAMAMGRQYVVGWEANGGFLVGTELQRNGRRLSPLPTRDAVLPILAVLASAVESACPVSTLFDQLPPRYGKSALLRNFPRERSHRLLKCFAPPDGFEGVLNLDEPSLAPELEELHRFIVMHFTRDEGFGRPLSLDYTDGVRISFEGGDVAHLRASGNADELRIYAIADTRERAETIADSGVREPGGILRCLEKHTLERSN